MSACTLYVQKLESLAYIFVADSMGLSLSKFVQCVQKDASFLHQSAFKDFKVIRGRWFSYQSKARMDFLLVGHCDYGPILHRFWYTSYWVKIAYFSYPSLIQRPRSPCSLCNNFAVTLSTRKLESSGYPTVKTAWVVLTQCQRVTVGWTDGRTDGRIYYS